MLIQAKATSVRYQTFTSILWSNTKINPKPYAADLVGEQDIHELTHVPVQKTKIGVRTFPFYLYSQNNCSMCISMPKLPPPKNLFQETVRLHHSSFYEFPQFSEKNVCTLMIDKNMVSFCAHFHPGRNHMSTPS